MKALGIGLLVIWAVLLPLVGGAYVLGRIIGLFMVVNEHFVVGGLVLLGLFIMCLMVLLAIGIGTAIVHEPKTGDKSA